MNLSLESIFYRIPYLKGDEKQIEFLVVIEYVFLQLNTVINR